MHFRHFEQSLRVVDLLEKGGKGLNLTHEVRAGIVGHSKGKSDLYEHDPEADKLPDALPLEAMAVRISDRIAYLAADIEDAVRAGLLRLEDLPQEVHDTLGVTHGSRIGTMVANVIENSIDKPYVTMTEPILGITNRLKDFMFTNVYTASSRDGESECNNRRACTAGARLCSRDDRPLRRRPLYQALLPARLALAVGVVCQHLD